MRTLYDFGNKQRMHTQMIGNTSTKEIFLAREFDNSRSLLVGLSFSSIASFIIAYFLFKALVFSYGFLFLFIALALEYVSYMFYKRKSKYERLIIGY